MDVTKHGEAILETSVVHFKAHTASFGHVLGLFALLAVGFTLGTAGISAVERRLRPRRTAAPAIAGGEVTTVLGTEELARSEKGAEERRMRALQTCMVIAMAIGLHNFAEGLAIGVSAKAGAVGLATVLIIGFGLHNATEGFGIVGPMSGEPEMPSWGFLGLMGLIGGGPTFLGTLIGQFWVSPALEAFFFAVAGGSILYVVIQLFDVCRRYGMPRLVSWMLLLGLLLGFGTDWVLVAAGA
jgi:ZIP family zinc transporter